MTPFSARNHDLSVLDLFWNTDIARSGRGVAVLCIFHEGDAITEWFESCVTHHAEEHLLMRLDQLYTCGHLRGFVKIDVFQNYSPCGKCSSYYTSCQMVNDWERQRLPMSLTVHFASLYRIQNEFKYPEDRKQYLTKRTHWLNLKGLKMLQKSVIQLKAFDQIKWAWLIGRLGIELRSDFDVHYEKERRLNDVFCADKLSQILACPRSIIPAEILEEDHYRYESINRPCVCNDM